MHIDLVPLFIVAHKKLYKRFDDEIDEEGYGGNSGGTRPKKHERRIRGGEKRGEELVLEDSAKAIMETTSADAPGNTKVLEKEITGDEPQTVGDGENAGEALEKVFEKEVIEETNNSIQVVEDLLAVLDYVGQREKDSLRFVKKREAAERLRKNGKLARYINSDGNIISPEIGRGLLQGIFYLGNPVERRSLPDVWSARKSFLEEDIGLDTDKINEALDRLYIEGREAEASLTRILSDGNASKETVERLRSYMESGNFPKGWRMANLELKNRGIKIDSFERMREIDKKKEFVRRRMEAQSQRALHTKVSDGGRQETRVPVSQTQAQTVERPEAQPFLVEAEPEVESGRTRKEDLLVRLTATELGSEEQNELITEMEAVGIPIKAFLEGIQPDDWSKLRERMRIVVEVLRMDEANRAKYPAMRKYSEDFARVMGLG